MRTRVLHRVLSACAFQGLIVGLSLQPVLAQPTIERSLPEINGLRFQKVEEITTLEDGQQLGPLAPDVLMDYRLVSYSHWQVEPQKPTEDTVVTNTQSSEMEVYEMQDSTGAFGVFSLWNLSGRPLVLPVENLYRDGHLVFWRGSYFFHLTGSSQQGLKNLASRLIQSVPQINIYPLTVVHLPQETLIPNSIRFYTGKASFALAEDFPQFLVNQMGFADEIEITRAQYAPGNHSLFLIGYPTNALAASYFLELQNALRDYFSPQAIYMKRSGVIISIFLGPEPKALEILAQVEYAPTIKWVYEKTLDPEALKEKRGEVVGFLGMVRRSVISTFFFMAFTLCAGILAGLTRYHVVNRYPSRPRRDQAIQLKIGGN